MQDALLLTCIHFHSYHDSLDSGRLNACASLGPDHCRDFGATWQQFVTENLLLLAAGSQFRLMFCWPRPLPNESGLR